MPRNQSFMHTTEQYRNHTKTVTRRLGWKFAKVGDVVNGCEKCQGLKPGEKIVVMGRHIFVDLRWEPLGAMVDDLEYGRQEVIKEGFPEMTPQEFVDFFCDAMKCTPQTLVHRMEFRYLVPSDFVFSVPNEVASCPYCEAPLFASCTSWEQWDDGWRRGEIEVDCAKEPPLEDTQAHKGWLKAHSYMPYVYQLPVDLKVQKWVDAHYRFDMEAQ